MVLTTTKCEVVIFAWFESACVCARPVGYLEMPYLFGVHVLCTYMHIMHARHDITRFPYDVNHVIILSAALAFHLCHIGMWWHDVISVGVA